VLALLLALTDPHLSAEVVWNRARTWGAYTIEDSSAGWGEQSTSLYVVSKDRRTRRHLLTGHFRDQRETELTGDLYVYPVVAFWAPDDAHVLFFKDHAERSGSYGGSGAPLFDVNVHTGKVRKLSMAFRQDNGYMDDRIHYDRTIAFSPDGKRLLLVMGTAKSRTDWRRLAVLDYRTLRRSWLTDHTVSASSPSWSPDGDWVVYSSFPTTGPEGDSARIGNRGATFRLLANERLWIVSSDGGERRQLTASNGTDTYPIWRSAGRIEFIRDDSEVWSVQPDGGGQRFVRELPAEESNFWRYGETE
jgi:hypothetical protein